MNLFGSALPKRRCLIIAFLLISHFLLAAQPPISKEYQLKAVFLYNFSQFVEWPANSFSSGQSPLVIGILGADPFGTYLEETIAGETVNGHPLRVRHFASADDVEACQILFINIADKAKRAEAVAKLKGKNILTVSDTPDFLQQGGMIRFFTRQDKIKLEVNLEAAKTADLVISSKLLRLSEIFIAKKNT